MTLPAPSSAGAAKRAQAHIVSWIVFAIGGGLILLAWAASLRARPVRLRGGKVRSGPAP